MQLYDQFTLRDSMSIYYIIRKTLSKLCTLFIRPVFELAYMYFTPTISSDTYNKNNHESKTEELKNKGAY